MSCHLTAGSLLLLTQDWGRIVSGVGEARALQTSGTPWMGMRTHGAVVRVRDVQRGAARAQGEVGPLSRAEVAGQDPRAHAEVTRSRPSNGCNDAIGIDAASMAPVSATNTALPPRVRALVSIA